MKSSVTLKEYFYSLYISTPLRNVVTFHFICFGYFKISIKLQDSSEENVFAVYRKNLLLEAIL